VYTISRKRCWRGNGKLREELVNGELFDTLLEAQVLVERWRQHYNACPAAQCAGVPATTGAGGSAAMGREHGSLTPDGTCTSNIEGGPVFGGRPTITQQLEDEGVEKLNKPFDKLMETLAQRSPRHLTRES